MHALDALLAREQFGIKLGLAPMRAVCAALDHPERRYRIVHVAGTNGKGSVTAMVAHALALAGHRTGRYTSPHIVDLTERFAIDDEAVSHETLERAAGRVLEVEGREREAGRITAPMTFFELCTAIGFVLFADAGCDIAVIEVGLGGRFDATNVVEPVVAAITNIAMDHTAHLGTTLEAIAFEKAGIVKPGVPLVLGAMPAAARATIVAVAGGAASPIIDAAQRVQVIAEGLDATGRTPAHVTSSLADYGALTLGLRGAHQQLNASVAVAVLETLQALGVPVGRLATRGGLVETRWPGRLEMYAVAPGAQVLLDAAHNADGARALAAHLATIGWNDVTCVFGVMRDKDAGEMIAALSPHVATFVVTQASTPRARAAADLAEVVARLTGAQTLVAPLAADALDRALDGASRIVVCGSIFLLGDLVRPLAVRGGIPV